MVTKQSPDSSEKESSSPPSPARQHQSLDGSVVETQNDTGTPGFFGMLVKSVFEPGANAAVVMAMNLCFFFLILTLFALAFLTGWNQHVLLLLGVTTLLWGSMMWFVLELTKVQTRPDNMPPTADLFNLDPDASAGTSSSTNVDAGTRSSGTAPELGSVVDTEPKKDR